MDLRFQFMGTDLLLAAERTARGWRVRLPGGSEYEVGVKRADEREITVVASASRPGTEPVLERVFSVPYARVDGTVVICWKGQSYRFSQPLPIPVGAAAGRPSGGVTSPAAGVVVDVLVEVGQAVLVDQQLAVVEAMKVMTPIESPLSGRVRQVFVTRGQRIEEGAPVAQIDAQETALPDLAAVK